MEKTTSSYHSDFGILKAFGKLVEQHSVSRLVEHGVAGGLFGMEKMLSDYAQMVLG
jgi:hypothetical protein